ncbi:hypothetical protein [Pacificibacter marinus]|uniref:Uncharacterized protein n=1 Tax=Pacificibacter marinus TaxID=658057 RepID=A0A1Y5TYR0_9RHOB|nr:hypothetical protein [Pacificibacter marinus]SEL44165.1 hypothetical protein SAMN04488032_1364 [Pacificibacter marinus]SLN71858.1 hypothetical protein PAM7971_03847 [Pacificibacter marinus]
MRYTRPGSIQNAVREAYGAVGGLENASIDLGIGVSTLSYGTERSDHRPGGIGVNYLDSLGRIEPSAAAPIAKHFATLAGGVFQPVDLDGVTASDVYRIAKEFSDVLTKDAEAHSKSSIDPSDYTVKEAGEQLIELDELIAVAVSFRAALREKTEVAR